MFEEYLNTGREVRVVFHLFGSDGPKVGTAFGELVEVTDFLKLKDQRTGEVRYVAVRDVVEVSPRPRRYGF
jgi:hypothetical protein